MEIGGRHIKRTRTEIEKEDRIVIKTEVVDELYDQNKVICGSYIQYKDIDPGNFVIKEEPQNESVGFVAQIKTEDCLNLPHEFANEPQAGSSSLKAPEIVYLKTERITPSTSQTSFPTSIAYLPSQPLDKGSHISVEEKNILSPKGGVIVYKSSHKVKENLDINSGIEKSEGCLDNGINLYAKSITSYSDKVGVSHVSSGEYLDGNRVSLETGKIHFKKSVIVNRQGDNYFSVPRSSIKIEDDFTILEKILQNRNARTTQNSLNENKTVNQRNGNYSSDHINLSKAEFSLGGNNKILMIQKIIPDASKVCSNYVGNDSRNYDEAILEKQSNKNQDISSSSSNTDESSEDVPTDLSLVENYKLGGHRRRVEAIIPKDKRFPVGNYKCYSCDKNFSQLSDWDDHMVLYLNSEGCYPVESKSAILNKREKALDFIVESDDFYKCTICSFTQCKTDTIRHVIDVHNKVSLKCAFCDKTVGTYKSLQYHLSYHHNPLRVKHKCPYCTYEHIEKNTIKTHVNVIHKKNGYKCDTCGRVCRDEAMLKRHVLNLHTESFKREVHRCTDCNFSSTSKQSLKRHIINKHRSNIHYSCHYCQYKTPIKDYLVNHIFVKHLKKTVKKRYKCDTCGVKVMSEVGLNSHIIKVHGKKIGVYNCSHCSAHFKTKHDCFIHTNLKHLSKSEFQCNTCEYLGTDKEDFIRHVNTNHLTTVRCEFCPVENTSSNHSCKHMKVLYNTDEGERYKCPECKYVAKTKVLFNQHMNVRHNPNAVVYSCHHCGHKNKIKHKLSQHMQTKHMDLLRRKKKCT